MQLGFVSAVFGDRSFEEVLSFAGSEGYDCVEVMCWPSAAEDRPYGGACHLDVTGFTQAKADDTRALCEKYGVNISALGYYANALSEDPNEAETVRKHFRKVIDAAKLLGLKNANGFVGANRFQPLEENL